ncbi:MAG: Gmad2 immunoglobulin-like domain-containing protein [Acidimicrobiales bacterium]
MTDLSTPPSDLEPSGGRDYWSRTPPWFVMVAAGLLGAILVALVVLGVLFFTGDDGGRVETVAPTLTTIPPTLTTATSTVPTSESTASTTGTTDTTSSTSTTSSTVTTASTTSSGSTSSTLDPRPYESAVWPWFDSTTRYREPTAAAEGFAVDFLGFDEPLIGEFQQGDSRSGEVEIRPTADGPVTTVLVRLLGSDDSWWVLGSVNEDIVIDEPDALDRIDSPLTVTGSAMAFEGVVGLELRADGDRDPLIDGFVMGGGTSVEPFDKSFTWTNPGTGSGALILMTSSAEDGRPWAASVLRVRFAAS